MEADRAKEQERNWNDFKVEEYKSFISSTDGEMIFGDVAGVGTALCCFLRLMRVESDALTPAMRRASFVSVLAKCV